MLNDLRYAVSFPTNGVSLSGHLSFQPGATAISGDNGAGKSFVAEMIRYGLFGKKALRGPASDYKTLDMELGFLDYRVTRAKKEQLVDPSGEVIAVGADAVNKKIVEILGFSLEVFDVVCVANQKESERLTRLQPAKRKELIDDVVGLTAQEAVEKACREEAKLARVEAEALTRALVLPVEPVKPDDYRPSAAVRADLHATRDLIATREELQRIIDRVGPEPQKPAEPVGDIEALETHERERVRIDAERAALERQLARIPEPQFTTEQLDAAEALAAYDADVARRGSRPDYGLDQLSAWREIWGKKQIANHGSTTCPKCSHRFVIDVNERDIDVDAVLALPVPPIHPREIGDQELRHAYWQDAPVEPKGDRLTAEQISTGRLALALAGDKPRLEAELAALPELDIKVNQLDAARTRQRQWDVYEQQHDAWVADAAMAGDASYELKQIPEPTHSLEALNEAFTAATVYEERLTDYTIAKARFDELTVEIAAKQERADAFTAGAKGLVEARRTLKAFLAPSLSRVASKIIRQMTENSLRPLDSIHIDDEMNITADGQEVSTFNGAHATMINLALRLALGQVLVARVFPVFIGDEIDSDATPANAQAIADGLMACKEQLKQIVIISHKRLEGVDHEVML